MIMLLWREGYVTQAMLFPSQFCSNSASMFNARYLNAAVCDSHLSSTDGTAFSHIKNGLTAYHYGKSLFKFAGMLFFKAEHFQW